MAVNQYDCEPPICHINSDKSGATYHVELFTSSPEKRIADEIRKAKKEILGQMAFYHVCLGLFMCFVWLYVIFS